MIDRQEELDILLKKLKQADTKNDSDMDLVLEYVEKYLDNPKMGGGSTKLQEFQIEHDAKTLAKIYHITWKSLFKIN